MLANESFIARPLPTLVFCRFDGLPPWAHSFDGGRSEGGSAEASAESRIQDFPLRVDAAGT